MAMDQGELRRDIDLELATDLLYGPIYYYRLLISTGRITAALHGHAIRPIYGWSSSEHDSNCKDDSN
jgi:hypothetical protein